MIVILIHKHKHKKPNKINNKSLYTAANYTILKNKLNKLNINVMFRTKNNIYKNLRIKKQIKIENKTGIYKIKCNNCEKIYIGQTSRSFMVRFKEHLPPQNLSNLSNIKSYYATHIIDNGHKFINFNTNLEPINFCNKSKYMTAIEEFEIHFKLNPQILLNNQLHFNSNYLFDTAIEVLYSQNNTDNNVNNVNMICNNDNV